jgi:hypothetical protein
MEFVVPFLTIPFLMLFKYGKPRGYLQDLAMSLIAPRAWCALERDSQITKPYLRDEELRQAQSENRSEVSARDWCSRQSVSLFRQKITERLIASLLRLRTRLSFRLLPGRHQHRLLLGLLRLHFDRCCIHCSLLSRDLYVS